MDKVMLGLGQHKTTTTQRDVNTDRWELTERKYSLAQAYNKSMSVWKDGDGDGFSSEELMSNMHIYCIKY